MVASSTATLLCLAAGYAALGFDSERLGMGLQPLRDLQALLLTIFLMAVFYAGPITTFCLYVYHSQYHRISADGHTSLRDTPISIHTILTAIIEQYLEAMSSLILFRNLLFAPITEEIAFRALMVPFLLYSYPNPHPDHTPLLQHSDTDPTHVALLCPLMFTVAHVHHLYEKLRNGTPLGAALAGTLLQVSYTGVFGFIATLLLMRTGRLLSPITSHVICNAMGLPNAGFMLPAGHGNEYSFLYARRWPLLALHAAGLIVFALLLFPLTHTLAAKSILWR